MFHEVHGVLGGKSPDTALRLARYFNCTPKIECEVFPVTATANRQLIIGVIVHQSAIQRGLIALIYT